MIERSALWLRAVVWCVLLVFSTGSLANASTALGTVLCIGGDGHLAVEIARGPDCVAFRAAPAAAETPLPAQQAGVRHCNDCLDIALGVPVSVAASDAIEIPSAHKVDNQPSVPAAAPAVRPAYAFVRVLERAPRRAASPPNSTLLAHRTTVLLI